MPLDAGDETVATGTLARAIYDRLETAYGVIAAPYDADRKEFCSVIANAVVDHLVANADVRVTTSDSGLQRDNTGGNPATLAPSADVVLSGAVE